MSEIDKEGNCTIKDGIAYEGDVFDKIPQPDAGSIEKAGQPQGSESPVVSAAEQSETPNIQLMPSLKGLVDTGKLSIENALEIDDVARQNNWSDGTVKQFHKKKNHPLPEGGLASLVI